MVVRTLPASQMFAFRKDENRFAGSRERLCGKREGETANRWAKWPLYNMKRPFFHKTFEIKKKENPEFGDLSNNAVRMKNLTV